MQKRKMHRVDIAFIALQIVAAFIEFGRRPIFGRDREKLVVRRQWRLARTHVSQNHAADFPARIGGMANRILMLAAAGLPRLLQAASCNIVEPTVIKAPQPSILHSAVAEIRPPVRTVEPQKSRPALIVAEQNQLFAEYFNFKRRAALGQFLRQSHRLPIPPQEAAARSSRTDLSE